MCRGSCCRQDAILIDECGERMCMDIEDALLRFICLAVPISGAPGPQGEDGNPSG